MAATKSKVERPTELQVGYAKYKVEWFASPYEWAAAGHPADTNGITECDKHRIALLDGEDRPEAHLRECLIHEVLHAAIGAAGLSHHFHNSCENDELEEYVVSITAPMLLQIMNDNPHLMAYLLSID